MLDIGRGWVIENFDSVFMIADSSYVDIWMRTNLQKSSLKSLRTFTKARSFPIG